MGERQTMSAKQINYETSRKDIIIQELLCEMPRELLETYQTITKELLFDEVREREELERIEKYERSQWLQNNTTEGN